MNTLTFQVTLNGSTLQIPNSTKLIGKEVLVTIVELPQHRPAQKRNWRFLGAIHFTQKLDTLNIRDLAYE